MFQLIIKKYRNIINQLLTIIILVFAANIIVSCTINDFSNEYNGKIVYSKNSDVIHRENCGETKHIKEENYCISTKSVLDMLDNNFRPCHVCLYYYLNYNRIFNKYISISDIDNYKNILEGQFGFWPNKEEKENDILNSLVYLYEGTFNSTNNVIDANIDYFRLIASLVYARDSSGYNNIDWSIVAGLYKNTNETKKAIIDKLFNVRKLEDKTLREAYYENISQSVIQQHDSNLDNDFAHLCAVISAYLTEDERKIPAEDFAATYNGIKDINAQAGYIGDICGANNAMPSLTVGDYAADLDAVNIYNRILNEKENAIKIVNDYYNGINDGTINRADEFVENIGIEKLQNHRQSYINYTRTKVQANEYDYYNRLNYVDNFIEHLLHSETTFVPNKYRLYNEFNDEQEKYSLEEIIQSAKGERAENEK